MDKFKSEILEATQLFQMEQPTEEQLEELVQACIQFSCATGHYFSSADLAKMLTHGRRPKIDLLNQKELVEIEESITEIIESHSNVLQWLND